MTPFLSLAFCLSAVFALLGLAHVYWALGGRLGLQATLPQLPVPPDQRQPGGPAQRNAFTPSPAATLAVAVVLLGVALAVALRGGLFGAPVQHAALRLLLGAVALALFARAVGDFRLVGFFKRVKGSAFARMDSRLYSPLCVALGAGLGWMAMS